MVGWQSPAPGSHLVGPQRAMDRIPPLSRTSFSAPEAHIVVSTDGYFDVYPSSARTDGDKPAYRGRLAELGAGIRGADDRLAVRPTSAALVRRRHRLVRGPRRRRPRWRARRRPRRQRARGVKRRKVTYPVARTHTKGAPRAGAGPEVAMVRPNLVAIDVTAGAGRTSLKVGGRVRIAGTGLYAGEEAIIERLVAGVIPAATVRTDGGGTRRVRTIDLEPIAGAR